MSWTSSLAAQSANSARDAVVDSLVVADEVHLVHRDEQVRDAEQRRDERMAVRLLEHALAGVDEDDRQVRGRGPRDHVARVLHVAGGVRDDELALRRREVAIRHVDRDALLALGTQAVGQEREVDLAVAAPLARPLDRRELVLEDALRVEEQPPDERRLAIVDRPGRGEPQEVHLEVALLLAVFHRGLAERVVRAGRATLGDPCRGDLRDDRLDVGRV